ncbi:MAG: F0F1 ATP synthase subunit A [Candidatus Levyibacteriota bacterium]
MVSFAAEPIIKLGFFSVTNSIIDVLIVDSLIIIACVFISRKISLIPGLFQNLIEYLIETFYALTESVADTRAARIFPYFMTFFIFILLINWSGLIPGVGTIGFFHATEHGKELIPLIRAASSDLNVTLALALVSAVATHTMSIQIVGIKDYLSKYFSLNPIYLFVGILEVISEITKVISLSFRLFGNIFAGEVVLITVSSLFAFLFPLPFMFLEIIVGLVQALVFSMLTMAFMAILTVSHHQAKEVSSS